MKQLFLLMGCLMAFLAGCHVESSSAVTTVNKSGAIIVSLCNEAFEAGAKEELHNAIEEYNSQHSGEIEIQMADDASHADIVLSSLSAAMSFQRSGQLLEIDSPDAIDGTIPMALQGHVLYYNQALFEACGYANPPQTWNELYAMAQQIQKQAAIPGFAIKDGNIGKHLEILFRQKGIPFTDPAEKTAAFDNDDTIQCLSLLKDGAIQGYILATPVSSLTTVDFKDGKIASFIGTPNDETWLGGNAAVALLPQDGMGDSRQVFQGIVAFILKSNQERQQAALSVVESLCTPGTSGRICAAGRYTSPFIHAIENTGYQVNYQTSPALSILEKAKTGMVVTYMDDNDSIALYQLENAWKDMLQGKDIAESLSSAAALTNYALMEN